jgi:hypothetical protein
VPLWWEEVRDVGEVGGLSMTAVIAAILLMVASVPAQAMFASAQKFGTGDSPGAGDLYVALKVR